MNIRFIILRAGKSNKITIHFENYEIGFGCHKNKDGYNVSREYASYEEALYELEKVQNLYPKFRYRLAAVWD